VTLLMLPGEGPAFHYAGQPVHILAGHGWQPRGFAALELTIPADFAGPVPHAHDGFDEAIYVLSGRLLVLGEDEPQEALPGSMFVAPRGHCAWTATPASPPLTATTPATRSGR
jgi:mannose-6-phosphate isomerase-like protein (cupin superfamily)